MEVEKNTNKYYYDRENFIQNSLYPIIYQIEITEKCNLNCPKCIRSKIKHPTSIDLKLIDLIIEQDYLRNTAYTELQMAGEPTLHPDLLKITKMLKTQNILLGLSTNLTILNDTILEAFNLLDSLTLSIDYLDSDKYEKARPPAKHKQLAENLNILLRNLKRDIVVYFQLFEMNEEEEKRLENIASILGTGQTIIVRYIQDCFVEQRGEKRSKKNTELCLNPFLTVSIKSDGTVVPCCFDFLKTLALGNLYNESLDDIWNNQKVVALRNAHKSGIGLPVTCQQCFYRSPIALNTSFLVDILKSKGRK